MKEFTEELRYDYPLKDSDWVIDAGAFEGNWSYHISKKYGCNVVAFEPILPFFDNVGKRLAGFSKAVVKHAGLGAYSRRETFNVRGDSSGIGQVSEVKEEVVIISIHAALVMLENRGMMGNVALMKLNIEGMEAELLEEIISSGITERFTNIQVQFHSFIPDSEARRSSIRESLSKTHHLTYDCPWVWENWALNL